MKKPPQITDTQDIFNSAYGDEIWVLGRFNSIC